MSILARFAPLDLTLAKYEDVNRRLEESGQGQPEGREYHVCFGEDGDLRISEIWESVDQFRAFGDVLMPILKEVGIEVHEPQLMPVQNQIRP